MNGPGFPMASAPSVTPAPEPAFSTQRRERPTSFRFDFDMTAPPQIRRSDLVYKPYNRLAKKCNRMLRTPQIATTTRCNRRRIRGTGVLAEQRKSQILQLVNANH